MKSVIEGDTTVTKKEKEVVITKEGIHSIFAYCMRRPTGLQFRANCTCGGMVDCTFKDPEHSVKSVIIDKDGMFSLIVENNKGTLLKYGLVHPSQVPSFNIWYQDAFHAMKVDGPPPSFKIALEGGAHTP